MTTVNKGDIEFGSGSSNQFGLQAAGSNGQLLTYDSTQTLGVKGIARTQVQLMCTSPGQITTNTTASVRYFGPAFNVNDTSEGNVQAPAPAGTLTNFYVTVYQNTATNSNTITVRKNGVSSTVVITIPASTTGTFSSSNSAAFNNGDLISFLCTQATTASVSAGAVSFSFASS